MKRQPTHNPQAGRLRFRLVVGLALLAVLTGTVFTVRAVSKNRQAEKGAVLLEGQTWTVKRGPLVISLLAPGAVKAKQSTEIKCMVHGDVKITWIIDEGTLVKPGDKLVELESSILLENTIRQRISVAQAQSEYEQAKQNLENQKSKNKSNTLIAKNTLYMATLDLEKYIEGDYKQKIREAEADIKLSEAELKRARERLEGTKKLLAKGYVNRGELEADTLAETKCAIELDKATNAKELLEKYEYKREVSNLDTGKQGAEEELKRIAQEAESELANKKTTLDSAKAELDLEKFQLDSLEEQLKNTVIFAPAAGMVVYAQNEYDDNARIRPGAQLHRQQKIIDLPDFSQWIAEARIHESMIQQVKQGQQCVVSIDAFQGQSLTGSVGRISMLPDSGRWFQPDTKEYLVNLELTTTTLPLKPGMSAKAEVLLDSLKDVLFVPVQAITTVDGKATVYVKGETGPRPQVVEVGLSNDRYAEIKTGLRAGDQVILSANENGEVGGLLKRPADQNEKDKDKEKEQTGEKGKGAQEQAASKTEDKASPKGHDASAAAKKPAPAQAAESGSGGSDKTS